MSKQRKPKVQKLPLNPEKIDLIWSILEKLNILLLQDMLMSTTTELAEEFEVTLKRRLQKEGREFVITGCQAERTKLNRQFFNEFCQSLQRFVDLNGFDVDWDKRRAETLLSCMTSLEGQART